MEQEINLIPIGFVESSITELVDENWGNVTSRINLLPEYEKVAKKYKCTFIDIYYPLINDYNSLTVDGIHLNENGYKWIAGIINDKL